jgi:transposase-like protein
MIIYTTNAIESINSVVRKTTDQRKLFPDRMTNLTAVYTDIFTPSTMAALGTANIPQAPASRERYD